MAFVALVVGTAFADVVIAGKTYDADTVMRRQVGPGIMNTIVRLPEYPLNIYILETDMTNPNNRVETTVSYNTVGRSERLFNALTRNRTATKRPIGICNANFWIVSGQSPYSEFALGTPWGGVVRNDTTFVNSSMDVDKWGGGPTQTGSSAVTKDGRIIMGRWTWKGTVSSPKVRNGQPQEYQNVNRRCIAGGMALWSGVYRTYREFEDNWTSYNTIGDNQTDNYYLMLKEGSSWAVGKEMVFVIANIVKGKDRCTLGNYDACLTCTGDTKEIMGVLEVGDELTITSNWTTANPGEEATTPEVENLVEGISTVMLNGELTADNTSQSYNSTVYSRTAYATNAEGNKLYQIVIDKSVSPKYGKSIGCNTTVMCQILQNLCPDVQHVINYDAGGSAEMAVGSAVINTTTEGIPRGVATGWMVEAIGPEDNNLAYIAFDDYKIKLPIYATYTPKILGYNQRGELISEDVKGVTLTCDPALGTTQGNTYTASSTPATGKIRATFGEMEAEVDVNIIAATPSIKVKPYIVLDSRDYPVEVIATAESSTFNVDPAMLEWTIDNPQVASLKNGTLRGLRNGTAHITCRVGEFVDETDVHVEIPEQEYMYQNWEGWTFKNSGHQIQSLDSDGTLKFTYGTSRVPYFAIDKDITFYSLPDTIGLVFTTSTTINRVLVDTRNYNFTKTNSVIYHKSGGYEPGTEHCILLDLDAMGGVEDVSTYPLSIKEIRFEPYKDTEENGTECVIQLKALYAHYPKMPKLGDLNGDDIVDVTDVNIIIDMVLGKRDTTPESDLNGDNQVDVSDVNQLIDIVLGK